MSQFKAFVFALLLSVPALANQPTGKFFDHAIFVIFENTNYDDALRQPFFSQLANQGATFSNFMALTHPSQGNYIALTSGSLNGVKNDNPVNLNVPHIVDLLDANGLTWKTYVEDYPGNCFTGASQGLYVRKHVPFISYTSITKNSSRCANIVNANEFDRDVANGNLPNYIFYIPNIKNDGHDTGVTYADKWYRGKFSKFVSDKRMMQNTILISTFDESGPSSKNQIYTSIVGGRIKPGTYANLVNIYSLLQLIETNWNLGDLGKEDATATPLSNIWQ